MARVLKVFFHDACFDGTTSAALFAAFYREVIDKAVVVQPIGMVHRDGDPFENVPLDADDHACVDFRFCADPKNLLLAIPSLIFALAIMAILGPGLTSSADRTRPHQLVFHLPPRARVGAVA